MPLIFPFQFTVLLLLLLLLLLLFNHLQWVKALAKPGIPTPAEEPPHLGLIIITC